MNETFWHETRGQGPVVAVALHDGHAVRDELRELLVISDSDRLREEDPYTGEWTAVAGNRLVAARSRFEVDLNRPRHRAVYRTPQEAWGLEVWKGTPSDAVVAHSLSEYDRFYRATHDFLGRVHRKHGRFVVLDLHSYNHRRRGPGEPPEDPRDNPQVNVGLDPVDMNLWGPLVDRLMHELRRFDFPGGKLDVRANVKFRGGYFSEWVNRSFPGAACSIPIEFKKFFMDEWTGEKFTTVMDDVRRALDVAVQGALEELEAMAPVHTAGSLWVPGLTG